MKVQAGVRIQVRTPALLALIGGRLPVDIPGIAQRGTGLSRQQTLKGGLNEVGK